MTPTDLTTLLADLPRIRNHLTYTPEMLNRRTAWEQWIIKTTTDLLDALEQMVKERDALKARIYFVEAMSEDRGQRLKEAGLIEES